MLYRLVVILSATFAMPVAVHASSIATLGAAPVADSPSIVTLGVPAPAVAATTDPIRTSALAGASRVVSRSIILLGEPKTGSAGRDDAEPAKAPAPSRVVAMPLVLRGDFGQDGGVSTPVAPAVAASVPEQEAAGQEPVGRGTAERAEKASKAKQESQGEPGPSPAEMDQ